MSELNLPGEFQAQDAAAANVAASDDDDEESTAFFAVVNANGTLARGHRATSATRLGAGSYEVVFRKNVTRCAYIATIGLSGSLGSSPPGQISVVGRAGNDRGVFVQTTNSAGGLQDLGFHLAVICRGEDDDD